jgi:hypothetical protein
VAVLRQLYFISTFYILDLITSSNIVLISEPINILDILVRPLDSSIKPSASKGLYLTGQQFKDRVEKGEK